MSDDSSTLPALTKAIKGLTVVLTCTFVLQLAQLALSGWWSFQTSRFARQTTGSTEHVSTLTQPVAQLTPEIPLQHLPPEKMISRSSVILLVTYMPEGKRFKAVVAEFLKRDPATTVYYAVGDEFRELSYRPKENETCGDGQVVFLVGSPAEMRLSYSFTGDRIGGLGGISIAELRDLVRKSAH
ncbi:MAG TPA: hypothetical protein VGM13_05740 [Thermoanaerobaculia bacterium]|jgi:hypothetical protein